MLTMEKIMTVNSKMSVSQPSLDTLNLAADYIRYEGQLVKESIIIVSKATDHNRITAHTFIQRVIDKIIYMNPHLHNILT